MPAGVTRHIETLLPKGASLTQSLSSGISFSGAPPTNVVTKRLTAIVSFIGIIRKVPMKTLAAGLNFTGRSTKAVTQRAFSAVLNFIGALTIGKITNLLVVGALSASGTIQRATAKALSGTLTFGGAIVKTIMKALYGYLYPGQINYVPNPSFEYDTVGSAPANWSTIGIAGFATGATTTVVNTTSFSGSNSCQVVTDGVSINEGMYWRPGVADQPFVWHQGATYTFGMYLRGAVGGETVTVCFNCPDGFFTTGQITLTTSWTFYSLTRTSVRTTASTQWFGVHNNLATAETFYVDGAILVPSGNVPTYFDGDSPGYEWNGVPGNSTSGLAVTKASGKALRARQGFNTPNLAPNPSFESPRNYTGWTSGGSAGTPTIDTTQANSGTQSARSVSTAAGTMGFPYMDNAQASNLISVQPNGVYSMGLYMKADAAYTGTWGASFYWYDSALALISTVGSTAAIAPSTSWQLVSNLARQAPSNAAYARMIVTRTSAGAGEAVNADAAMVVSGSTLPTYSDSSTWVSLMNATTKRLAGALSLTGNLVKRVTKALGGSLSFTGRLTRATTHKLSATLSLTGSQSKAIKSALTAVLSFTGAIFKAARKSLSGSLRFTGILTTIHGTGGQAFTLALAATLSAAGTLKRTTTKALAGILSFAGTSKAAMQQRYIATLGFAGTVRRSTVHTLQSALSFTGQKVTAVKHALTATLTLGGNLSLSALRLLVLKASLNFVGAVNRAANKSALASVGFAGRVNQTVLQSLASALNLAGASRSAIHRSLQAVLTLAATLTTNINRVLALRASLSLRGSMIRMYMARQVNMMRERAYVIQRSGKNNIREFRVATKKAVAWRKK